MFWAIAFVLFLMNWGIGAGLLAAPGSSEKTIRINAVQANISREDKSNIELYDQNIEHHMALIRESLAGGPADLVVWPETAFISDVLQDAVWRPRLEEAARQSKVSFLIGAALLKDGHNVNSAVLLSPEGRWKDVYGKRHLVPFSEYRPVFPAAEPIISALGKKAYDFVPGTRSGILFLGKTPFGVAICSEEGYPTLFRELALQGAGFMVVMLNDGWFRYPQALKMHAFNSIFRAVETRRVVVRIANTGWTVAFDAYGRRVFASPVALQRAGFGTFDIVPGQGCSPYVMFGDFFAVLCWAFVIIVLVVGAVLSRKKKIKE
ncbi:MAG: apolipoprotein N-acyltransferase [Candidatus Omnitrophica bacterium]|nr:apolipoprotein N-acyltransferase [Candidatus Omnitrophota bacterium]